MARQRCTATILTLNEESNLAECLDGLSWADEIVVVDSGSTDRTLEIARRYTPAVYVNPWPGFTEQKNFAASKASHPWIFNLDADERVTPELRSGLLAVLENPQHDGYEIPRDNYFLGRHMKWGGWSPDRVLRLYREKAGRYGGVEPHAKVLLPSGSVGRLDTPMIHFTYRSFAHFVSKQTPYAQATARARLEAGKRYASLPLRIFVKSCWKFFEVYCWKLGLLDGTHGLVAALGYSYRTYLQETFVWERSRSSPSRISPPTAP